MRIPGTWIAWTMAAVASAAAGAWLARQHDSSNVTLASGTWLPEARPAPQFELVSHTGAPFTGADLRGRPTLVFFGFTHCPDVCPSTLAKLAEVKRRAELPALRVVMVSVDPERDSPPVLASYLTAFDPEFVGLTGEKRTIEALAKELGVAVARTELPGETYTMDHSATVYLFDARGALVGVFTPPLEAQGIATDLRGASDRLAG